MPYPPKKAGCADARPRTKTTMILYKNERRKTAKSWIGHSFNQRARDSSSLERTKIPRRIVRFLVGFSVFWGSAHFCTLFAHRRESRVFPCIVCILCIVSVFSILFSGEQQAGELTPLLGVHSFSQRVIAVLLCVYVRTFHFSHIRPPVKMINARFGMERAM